MSDSLKSVSISTPILITATTGGIGSEIVSSASATTSSLPSALGNLSAGNILAGVVVDRGRGNVILKTDRGLLQLTTSLALKLGSEVLLEVQSVGAQIHFAVVSVDHRPPATIGTDLASSSQSLIADVLAVPDDEQAPPSSNPRTTIIGRLLTAEIITPSEVRNPSLKVDSIPGLLRRIASLTATVGNAAATDVSDSIQSTTERLPIIPNVEALERILAAVGNLAPDVVETLLDGSNPAAPQPPTTNDSEPQTASPSPRADLSTMENINGGNKAATPAPSPKFIAIRPLEVLSPPAGGLGPTSLLHPQATGSDSITLFGTVVRSNANSAELSTPLGTLRLSNVGDLKEGSAIAFEIVTDEAQRGSPILSMVAAIPQRTLTAEPPHDWPALRNIASALTQNTAINTDLILPKVGEMLGPAMLAFIVNLRSGGNAKTWLGKSNIDALDDAVRDRLLDGLDGELSAESRTSGKLNDDGWQTTAVPIADGQHITEIRIHTQKRRNNHEGNEDSGGSRFVIEATLSALGPLQLDGLVRMHRFDLIVRTARPLPDDMRHNIETLFANSLSATNHLGGVSFRSDASIWHSAINNHKPHRSGVIA